MDLSTILSFLDREGNGYEITIVLEHSSCPFSDKYSLVVERIERAYTGVIWARGNGIHDYGRKVTNKYIDFHAEHICPEIIKAMVSASSYKDAINALWTTRYSLPCCN